MIFAHVTLIDIEGEPIRIRCWMPEDGGKYTDYPIDLNSFWLLAKLFAMAVMRRMPRG